MANKICSAREAAGLLKDGDVLICSGQMNMCLPEEICIAIEKRWKESGNPEGLTLFSASGVGDLGTPETAKRGFEHFAHEGMIKRVIAGDNGSNHKIMRLQQELKVESYNLPYGVLEHMIRARAEGKDFYISKVGIGTFVDPRIEGGKTNSVTHEDIVSVTNINGDEYLLFFVPKFNIAMIRATTADEDGNLSCEDEAAVTDILAIAMATHSGGGKVLAQVKRVVQKGSIRAHDVVVPGIFVDKIIVCEN